jgi:hypothetical protein
VLYLHKINIFLFVFSLIFFYYIFDFRKTMTKQNIYNLIIISKQLIKNGKNNSHLTEENEKSLNLKD